MSTRERQTVKLTEQQRRRHADMRRQVTREKKQISREAQEHKAERDALMQAFRLLKDERERRGLSLSEVSARSGIDKSYLSKLENDPFPNATLGTLMRIAEAIGVELTIGITRPAAA
jgi:ribosome-binding protein aMBF1 (putative translation factor)